jgi:hypothetical protein
MLMTKYLIGSILLAFAFATPALADLKPGQYAGVRKCTGQLGDISIDVTSKRTIGVSTCNGELQKKFIAKGACVGHSKEKLTYAFQFGDEKDPARATGDKTLYCK